MNVGRTCLSNKTCYFKVNAFNLTNLGWSLPASELHRPYANHRLCIGLHHQVQGAQHHQGSQHFKPIHRSAGQSANAFKCGALLLKYELAYDIRSSYIKNFGCFNGRFLR